MKPFLLLALVATMGCKGADTGTTVEPDSDTDTDTDTASRTTSILPQRHLDCPVSDNDPADTGILSVDQLATAGTCTTPTAPCEPVAVPIVLEVQDEGAGFAIDGPIARVITTESAWQSLWSGLELDRPLPTVDFMANQLLVSGYLMNSTCEAPRVRSVAEQCGDTVRLTVESIDYSGTCGQVCDASGGSITIVAIPRDTTPEVCSATCLTCLF